MGIFDKFRKGLQKTRDEGITAQMDEVIETYDDNWYELAPTVKHYDNSTLAFSPT